MLAYGNAGFVQWRPCTGCDSFVLQTELLFTWIVPWKSLDCNQYLRWQLGMGAKYNDIAWCVVAEIPTTSSYGSISAMSLWTHAQRCVHVIFCRCFFHIFLMAALVGQTAERIFTKLSHVVDNIGAICEPTRSIYSWPSLNYTVGQKKTKFCIFFDPTRTFSALTPERGKISQF